MSDNPKDDDWGMTMPPPKRSDQQKPKESTENFAPKTDAAPSLPPDDDWAMTAPNVKIPQDGVPPNQTPVQPSDFDKTAPNLNIPPQFSEQPKQTSAPVQPSDDWGVSPINVNVPKESKKDEWQMPEPVFRKSEGETPVFDKTMPNFNLKNLNEDFGSPYDEEDVGNKTSPYYQLPENQSQANAVAEAAPTISEQAVKTPPKPVAKAKSGNTKWVLMLGGLFAFFVLVTAGLVGAYFLYFNTPNAVKSNSQDNKPIDIAPTAAPTAAPTSVPTAPTSALPTTVNYKGEMVLVAAGEFTMGSDTGGDESKPAHKVPVSAFYIDKTEVTNAQYKEFCKDTGKTPPPDPFWEKGYFDNRPNAPVVGVSFNDAKAFAAWAGKRLPTEAEWEKAASWNETTQSKFEFPWGNSFENGRTAFELNASNDEVKTTKDVGSFPSGASPSGAMDMAGNAAEWVEAFFQPYSGNTVSNPNFGETNRVARGGNFDAESNDLLKTTKRNYVPLTVDEKKLSAAAIGFRCAISADDARVQEFLKK